jgi:hypothetical protein
MNELKDQAKRKIEMELAHESAIKAFENNVKGKKLNADEMKIKKEEQEKKRMKMK